MVDIHKECACIEIQKVKAIIEKYDDDGNFETWMAFDEIREILGVKWESKD